MQTLPHLRILLAKFVTTGERGCVVVSGMMLMSLVVVHMRGFTNPIILIYLNHQKLTSSASKTGKVCSDTRFTGDMLKASDRFTSYC